MFGIDVFNPLRLESLGIMTHVIGVHITGFLEVIVHQDWMV